MKIISASQQNNRVLAAGTSPQTQSCAHMPGCELLQTSYCTPTARLLFRAAALQKSYQKHSRQQVSMEISSNSFGPAVTQKTQSPLGKLPHTDSHTILTNFLHTWGPSCDPQRRYRSQSIYSLRCRAATQGRSDLEKRLLCWCDSGTGVTFLTHADHCQEALGRIFCRTHAVTF